MIDDMITLGYRVYKYKGYPTERIFLEFVKLDIYPNLIFVKNKKIKF